VINVALIPAGDHASRSADKQANKSAARLMVTPAPERKPQGQPAAGLPPNKHQNY